MNELKQKSVGIQAFRYKTKGICKQEKKRTGRCGECLDMDELEKKKDDGKDFDEQEKLDYPMLLRHKVGFFFDLCIIQSLVGERRDFTHFERDNVDARTAVVHWELERLNEDESGTG
jgi:hypothetical protein